MPFLHRCLLSSCLLLAVPSSLLAQSQGDAAPQLENVRLDYAQVLNVEPVYETLRASRAEVVCEDPPKPATKATQPEEGRLARAWTSVKEFFGSEERQQARQAESTAAAGPRCRSVPSSREFQRPIAYDVDYSYKGMKYRSRLVEDPGNRLRIRISVMPYQPAANVPASEP